MKIIYALIWSSSASEEEFEREMPDLMSWLKTLHISYWSASLSGKRKYAPSREGRRVC
jgi:hypothetical protein